MSVEVLCPYCHESIFVMLYAEDGSSQEFTYDCEVCCRPIEIKAAYDDSQDEAEWSVQAERSSGYE